MNKEQKELIKKLDLVEDNIKYPISKYNKDENLICKTYADGTKYEYNKDENLICKTYANGTKYEYNKDENLICKTYADGIYFIDGKYYKKRKNN